MDEQEFISSKEVERLVNIYKKQLLYEYLNLVGFEVETIDPIILQSASDNLKLKLYEEGSRISKQRNLDMEKRLRDILDDLIQTRGERDAFERVVNNQRNQSRVEKLLSSFIGNLGTVAFGAGVTATVASFMAGDIPSMILAFLLTLVGLFAINAGDASVFKLFQKETRTLSRQTNRTNNIEKEDRVGRLGIDESNGQLPSRGNISGQHNKNSRNEK